VPRGYDEKLPERDGHGQVTKLTEPDPDGAGPEGSHQTLYQYDAQGNLTQITYPESTPQVPVVESWVYDPTWNVPTSHTDVRGNVTEYTLDPANGLVLEERRVVGEVDDGANGETDDVVTDFQYTAAPGDPSARRTRKATTPNTSTTIWAG
jgi:hypothetical protein